MYHLVYEQIKLYHTCGKWWVFYTLHCIPLRWLCSCFSWENTLSAWIFTAIYCCACRPYWCGRESFSSTNDRKSGSLSRSANTFENIISQSHKRQKCWKRQKYTRNRHWLIPLFVQTEIKHVKFVLLYALFKL